jgi:autotransporter-associated beta strand protein
MARPLRFALLSLLLLALAPSSAFAARDVTIVSGTGATGFTVTTPGGVKTYTATSDDATLGADTLATDLASSAVTVTTGSDGFQLGNLTVSSAVTTDSTATGTLTLSATQDLTVSAQMDVAGQLNLNSSHKTTISAAVNPFKLITDDNGENFVTADITAVNSVSLGGQTSSLAAHVSSGVSDVDFLGPIFLGADSTVDAAGDVDTSSGLDGAYALTVNVGGTLDLGYTGGAIDPTSLAVNGDTTMSGDSVQVAGPLTFNGDVSRVGSATFYATDFELDGTLTAGDVTVNPTGTATFADGSLLGTEVAPLTTIAVNGATSLGNTTVRTSSTQTWNGTVAVTGTASMVSVGAVTFADALDGPGSLTVDPGSNAASFFGSIGSTTALTALSVSGTQTSSFTGGVLSAGSASFAGLDFSGGPSSVAFTVTALSVDTNGINTSSHALTVTGGGTISGPISGVTASLTKAGTGTLVLGGTNTYEFDTTVSAGVLQVDGSIPNDVVLNGGVVSGTGTIGGNITSTGGGVSPGASPGILTVDDDVILDAASTFTVELNGATPGTGYDQLSTGGQLTLGGATLHVTAADSLPIGQPLTIIDKISGLGVDGTFAGLPEGAVFDVGSVRLQISYTGGGDNDANNVTLTRVKQPTSLALTSGPANATEGSAVTLTATVSGPAGAPTPTGTVTFKDGSTVLGTAPVSNGVATLTTSALAAGDHSLRADFASDLYEASTASASQHIEAKPAPPTPVTETPPSTTPAPVTTPATETPISIKVADAKGKEKAKPGFVIFVVSLSKASDKPVTVKFATKNGTAKAPKDFKAIKGTLTFKPGQTRLLVKVRIVNDRKKEKTERFSLKLSGPAGATLARGTATGTIRDDD